MDKDTILAQIIKSTRTDRADINHQSDSDSQYGGVIVETNTHDGSGMDCSTTDLVEAIDLLTKSELWELNCKLSELNWPVLLADSPGIKPQGPRQGRP